jgi:phosphomannomutase
VRVDDLTISSNAMARLRAQPPRTLLGEPVTVEDLLPDADVVRLRWSGGRVVVRPSGTEPKLKAYLEVVPADRREATGQRQITALRSEVGAVLGLHDTA